MQGKITDIKFARQRRDGRDRSYCKLAALMKLYWLEHLRFPSSVSELHLWARNTLPLGENVDPDAILTHRERQIVIEQARALMTEASMRFVNGGRSFGA
jgi:hypothetical protein